MLNILARHSSFLRPVCGIYLSPVCLVGFLGIQESHWKELFAQCLSASLSNSCAIICASEVNPANDLWGHFIACSFL